MAHFLLTFSWKTAEPIDWLERIRSAFPDATIYDMNAINRAHPPERPDAFDCSIATEAGEDAIRAWLDTQRVKDQVFCWVQTRLDPERLSELEALGYKVVRGFSGYVFIDPVAGYPDLFRGIAATEQQAWLYASEHQRNPEPMQTPPDIYSRIVLAMASGKPESLKG